MNKVFISGMVTETPTMRMEGGSAPHLVFDLSVRHKTRSGEQRKEAYRISAWNRAAQWGAENITRGQIIGVQGYLTQRKTGIGASVAIATEIAVEEFLLMNQKQTEKSLTAGYDEINGESAAASAEILAGT